MSNKSGVAEQIISLPSGGGAQSGMGEKFSPDLFTGTGNFTIPLSLPLGRNDFQPEVSLVYSTGNGNGPFGLGWGLGIPGVARKTSKGVPIFDEKKDIFILSGAEDLIPINVNGSRTQYRPRTEGLYAIIERVLDADNDYWEVKSKDGLISYYGTPNSKGLDPGVISDPEAPVNVSSWSLTETKDPFGNLIVYTYERDLQQTNDRYWNQLYLSNIKYVDYQDSGGNERFLINVKFEYEDRPDPFSSFRNGFEIRTTRRCVRISVETKTETDTLKSRTFALQYTESPFNGVSLLRGIQTIGHDGLETQSLPPVSFQYTELNIDNRDFFPLQGSELPARSLANPDMEFVDLFGNGLPDIIQMNGTIRYWRNLGKGRFDIPRLMKNSPGGLSLEDSDVQMLDANGEGKADLMVNQHGLSGYYPLKFTGEWDRRSFQKYHVSPSFSLQDPEVRLFDLDGDGVTDALRTSNRFECFFQDSHEGWKRTLKVERQRINSFPDVSFSDPRVKLADLTGDGLQDIVLVHDGNIEYWPNMGHGKWGKRIHMANSPRFPHGYDPKRILIGDVDGDGLADIVYVGHCNVLLWINQSGNGWSAPLEIEGTPLVSDTDAVRLTDLLGSGVKGILWSTDATNHSRNHMYFLDFTGGDKPYLLREMDNNIGAITRVGYKPSTDFYLADQRSKATHWKTHLPFPSQVVSKVEIIDAFSKGKLTTEYRYHHGYWDGAEHEFRGFGMVEHYDSEVFEEYHGTGLHGDADRFEDVDQQFFSPPTLTKTWFHQGPLGDEFGVWYEADYSDEFWKEDQNVFLHPNDLNILLATLPRRAERDALRSLRGREVRTELYGLDSSGLEGQPYTVTENQSSTRLEFTPSEAQIMQGNLPGSGYIFFAFTLAQRTTQWERGNDPLTQITFTDNYDSFGQPQSFIETGVPRGREFITADANASEPYLVKFTSITYTNPINTPGLYLVDRVAKTTVYDIPNDGKLDVFSLKDNILSGSANYKIEGQTFNYYDGNAYQGLPFRQLGQFGALTRIETLILTDDLVNQAYTTLPPYLDPNGATSWNKYPNEFRSTTPVLAGYLFRDNANEPDYATGYYAITQQSKYDFQGGVPNPRGLELGNRDPLNNETQIIRDDFQLFPITTIDPKGLEVSADYDYRVMKLNNFIDPNGNRTAYTFTPMGLLEKTIIMGKTGENVGDTVDEPSVKFEYNLLSYLNTGQPISTRAIARENHFHDGVNENKIITIEYSDGFGRLLQTRTQAEDTIFGGDVFGNAGLSPDQNAPNTPAIGIERNSADPPNVLVSGWQIYNNKLKVVEKYEPFYSQGWEYNAPVDAEKGQKITMFYDPRSNVTRTLNPNGSEQRVILGIPDNLNTPDDFTPTPWEAYTYDANDLASITHPTDTAIASDHYFTPSNQLIDAFERIVRSVNRNGQGINDEAVVAYKYDIRGNIIEIKDPLGRTSFERLYDLMPDEEEDEEDSEEENSITQEGDESETNGSRVIRTIQLDGGLTTKVFDANGNHIEQRNSKGALVLNTFDKLNRQDNKWSRDNNNELLSLRIHQIYGDSADLVNAENFNLKGNLYKQYDEAGLVTIGLYDFKGNIAQKIRKVISDDEILTVFTGNPQINPYRVGWSVDWSDANAVNNKETQLLDGKSFQTDMLYDALNRVIQVIYPEDVGGQRKLLNPLYNRAGNLQSVNFNGTPFVRHIAYNAKGDRTLIAYGNNTMTRYAYDPQTFRLLRLRTEKYTENNWNFQPGASANLQDYVYRYDLVGNLVQITDKSPNSGIGNTNELIRQFQYDPLYRLTVATGRECDTPNPNPVWDDSIRCTDPNLTRGYERNYQYDLIGNIEKLIHVTQNSANRFTKTFNHTAGKNTLNNVQIGNGINKTVAYQYDDTGNIIQENASRFFEWDCNNQLRAFYVQANSNAPHSKYAHYLYDKDQERVKKLVRKQGGEVEVTIYIDGLMDYQYVKQANVITEENNTLHILDDEKRIGTQRVGNAFQGDTTPAIKFNYEDHIGSSALMLDTNGNLIDREEYFPFGDSSFGSYGKKRYRFSGKEKDEGSGLYYFGARYYLPWLCRWANVDPMTFGFTEWSPYIYVQDNPTKFYDPDGKAPKTSISSADATKQLNKIAKQFNKDLNNLWSKSFKSGGKTVQEWAAIITKSTSGGKTTFHIRNKKGLGSGSGSFSITPPAGEVYIGYIHTHPYSHAEIKSVGGKFDGKGVPFSAGDIESLRSPNKLGEINIVETGTKRFALVIIDSKKSKSFFTKNSASDITKKFNAAFKKAKGTFQRKSIAGVKAVVGKSSASGIGFFVTKNKAKTSFRKLN